MFNRLFDKKLLLKLIFGGVIMGVGFIPWIQTLFAAPAAASPLASAVAAGATAGANAGILDAALAAGTGALAGSAGSGTGTSAAGTGATTASGTTAGTSGLSGTTIGGLAGAASNALIPQPEVPVIEQPTTQMNVDNVTDEARRKAAMRKGIAANIKTSGAGDTSSANIGRTTLLGTPQTGTKTLLGQ